jgi:purine-binding chemotaxis protein CheW
VSEENRNQDRARQAETSDRYLAFQVGGEPYAIPLLQVKEVIEMSEPMPLPHSPSYFKGVINLRGQVICVLDLRLKLKLANVTNGPKTAIIILDIDMKANIGIIVDRINNVVAFHNEDISADDSLESMRNKFITGIARRDNKMTLILDVRAALSVQDLNTAQQSIDQKKAS